MVTLAKVYDITGAEVAALQLGDFGSSFSWDGNDINGTQAPRGVYIYQIHVEGRVFTGTMVVAR